MIFYKLCLSEIKVLAFAILFPLSGGSRPLMLAICLILFFSHVIC